MKKIVFFATIVVAVFLSNSTYGQWSNPNNNNDVVQTWDDVWMYDDVLIFAENDNVPTTNLTFSNRKEDVQGLIFNDFQNANNQYGKILFNSATSNFEFYVYGTYAGSNSSHNVLMKLMSNRTLRLDGTFYAKEIFVQTSIWSDFVFDRDYELMTLKDLEVYINTNKHLPNIPTTATVTEKGVNVAEMNKLLLQKVEELTLYVINLQKQINAIQKK